MTTRPAPIAAPAPAPSPGISQSDLSGAASDELAIQMARLDAAVSNMAEGLCMFDANARLVISNQLYADIYELPADLVRPGTPHREIAAYRIAHGMKSSDGRDFIKQHEAVVGDMRETVETVQLHNGRVIMIRHEPLAIGGWVATHLDITEQVARERELKEQNVRFDAAINNIQQGLCMFDGERRLIVSNRRYAEMYDIPVELIIPGMLLEDVLRLRLEYGNEPIGGAESYVKKRLGLFENQGAEADIVEFRNGRVISILHRPMPGGGKVSTHQDITEQRRTEARVRHLARHDPLTDLPNRTQFQERIDELQSRIQRGSTAAVLSLDLDRYKAINDTLGHAAGDLVLKSVAARLLKCCREGDLVARLGGDEFAILQEPINGDGDSAALARRIVEAIGLPFDINGHQVSIGASVGIALAPGDGTDAETLMKAADLALYRAKKDGRGMFHFYETGMDAALQRRRVVENDLRNAIARDELGLVFQPVLSLAENRIHTVEALLRWQRGGVAMSPAEFLPIAEESGLIIPIGEWVLRRACATAATWPEGIRVTVNLSPTQFKTSNLYEQVHAALAAAHLDPERLEIEVTEKLLLGPDSTARPLLHRLRDLGVSICIDDFGSGESSLGYLRSFPFDRLKIDKTFVQESSDDPASEALVKAVVALGRSLGMATTAEGVETEAQMALVRAEGCSEAQGYLLSPPLPPGAITDFLVAHSVEAEGLARARGR